MCRPLVVSLAAFVLVLVPRFVGAQDSCDKPFVVSEVSLPTTTHLSASEQAAIRGRLMGRCFENQQLRELADSVRELLRGLGYLQARIPVPSIGASDASRYPQCVTLNVEVEEGLRYKVREIDVIGSSFKQIITLSQIQVEDYFDGNKMRETVDAMHRLYAANGYFSASIVPEIGFMGGFAVRLSFKVVEGPQSP